MRISWLSAAQHELAMNQFSLVQQGVAWDVYFAPAFAAPPAPAGMEAGQWLAIAEHVARAERITAVLRTDGLGAARARFGASPFAIETATVAAAAHFAEEAAFADVVAALRCPIDALVFYANLLELLTALAPTAPDSAVFMAEYETFIGRYQAALGADGRYRERVNAAVDGLADLYVARGHGDRAEPIFLQRHDEDRNDVAVALSASRAYLAAGLLGNAVAWLTRAAERARGLGRVDMAEKLEKKRAAIHGRMS